jgi:hypothetical protein
MILLCKTPEYTNLDTYKMNDFWLTDLNVSSGFLI